MSKAEIASLRRAKAKRRAFETGSTKPRQTRRARRAAKHTKV